MPAGSGPQLRILLGVEVGGEPAGAGRAPERGDVDLLGAARGQPHEGQVRAVRREGRVGDGHEALPLRRADVERTEGPDAEAGGLAASRGRALVGAEVEPVADPVLRGEDEDVLPQGGDAVVDRVQRLHARLVVRGHHHRGPGVLGVGEHEVRPPALAVEGPTQDHRAVRRGGAGLRLAGEVQELVHAGQVLAGPEVGGVGAPLQPGLPAGIDLLQGLAQHALHQRREARVHAIACRAHLASASQRSLLDEGLDLLAAVHLGHERHPRLAELVGGDVAQQPVLGEGQDLVVVGRVGVPDEVPEEAVGLDVDPALGVVLGDPLHEPERQGVDGGAGVRPGQVQHLLDLELVHELVARDLDEPGLIAEVGDRHLEVLGRGHAQHRLGHLEHVLRLELALGGVEDERDPPGGVVVEVLEEARIRGLDRRERAAGLLGLAPVEVEPQAAGPAAQRRDVDVLPGEAVPGHLVLARPLRVDEHLLEPEVLRVRQGRRTVPLLRLVGQALHGGDGVARRGAPEAEDLRGGREGEGCHDQAGEQSHRRQA